MNIASMDNMDNKLPAYQLVMVAVHDIRSTLDILYCLTAYIIKQFFLALIVNQLHKFLEDLESLGRHVNHPYCPFPIQAGCGC